MNASFATDPCAYGSNDGISMELWVTIATTAVALASECMAGSSHRANGIAHWVWLIVHSDCLRARDPVADADDRETA